MSTVPGPTSPLDELGFHILRNKGFSVSGTSIFCFFDDLSLSCGMLRNHERIRATQRTDGNFAIDVNHQCHGLGDNRLVQAECPGHIHHIHNNIFIGYIVIWFYWKGRNWARILVLLTSLLSLYNLHDWTRSGTMPRIMIGTEAILAVFLLYWLNTRQIRTFFRNQASNKT